MTFNIEASEQCVDVASREIGSGNLEKAEKLLNKALSLNPENQKAAKILINLKAGKFDKDKSTKSSSTTTDGVHRRRPATAPKPEEPKLGEDYTKEQKEIVDKLKKCKDYYEVLGITKESTDTEIKKAYKKLALQLHPDKNKAPGSVEAFKAIGNAVAILTDAEKRKQYDLYGPEEERSNIRRTNSFNHQGYRTHEYAYARGFESEFTAEELFNMFFGGGFPQQAAQTRYRRYNQHHHEASTGQSSLAFGLILLFIIVSMLSTFFVSDPMYSLSPSSKYPVERKTLNHRIPYYVKENFASEYQGSLGRLESSVEEEYIMNMKRACFSEKNYREAMMSRARSFGSRTQYAQAQALKTPSCDALYRLGISGRTAY